MSISDLEASISRPQALILCLVQDGVSGKQKRPSRRESRLILLSMFRKLEPDVTPALHIIYLLLPGPLEPQSLQLVLSGFPLFVEVSLVPLLLPALSFGGALPLSPMVVVVSREFELAANVG